MSTFQLLRGDCLDLMCDIPAASVDLVLTDPPYGTTQCKWDAVIPFGPMWASVKRVLKPAGVAVFTASQPFTSALIMSNVGSFRQELVWRKNKASGHLNAKRRPLTAHENILVFYEGSATYNPQKSSGHRPATFAKRTKPTQVYGSQVEVEYVGGNTDRYPTTVLDFAVVNNDGTGEGRFHPTQKPVEMMEWLIRTYTNAGETVLDFTMGSGSTGVAALQAGRNFIGIERDEGYFKIAQDRIRATELSLLSPTEDVFS